MKVTNSGHNARSFYFNRLLTSALTFSYVALSTPSQNMTITVIYDIILFGHTVKEDAYD